MLLESEKRKCERHTEMQKPPVGLDVRLLVRRMNGPTPPASITGAVRAGQRTTHLANGFF